MSAECQCGCGQPAPIARWSHRGRGYVKGEPKRFVQGHGSRSPEIRAFIASVAPRGTESRFWKGSPEERFTRFVGVPDENGCLPWLGQVDGGKGYGRFWVAKRTTPATAHRFAYERANGPIPEGLVLHHSCENKLCVNVDHLVPMTTADHQELHRRDARRRAREASPSDAGG